MDGEWWAVVNWRQAVRGGTNVIAVQNPICAASSTITIPFACAFSSYIIACEYHTMLRRWFVTVSALIAALSSFLKSSHHTKRPSASYVACEHQQRSAASIDCAVSGGSASSAALPSIHSAYASIRRNAALTFTSCVGLPPSSSSSEPTCAQRRKAANESSIVLPKAACGLARNAHLPAFAGFFAVSSAIIFLISSIAPATLSADISTSPFWFLPPPIMLNVFTDSPITSVPFDASFIAAAMPSAVVGSARSDIFV